MKTPAILSVALTLLVSGCAGVPKDLAGIYKNTQASEEMEKLEMFSLSHYNADGSRKSEEELDGGGSDQDLAVILMTGKQWIGGSYSVEVDSSDGLRIAQADLSNKFCLFTKNPTLLADGGWSPRALSENLKLVLADRGFNPSDNGNRLYTLFNSCLSTVEDISSGRNLSIYSEFPRRSDLFSILKTKHVLVGRDISNAHYPPSLIVIDRDLIPQFDALLDSSMAITRRFFPLDPVDAKSQYTIIGSIAAATASSDTKSEAQRFLSALDDSNRNREKTYEAGDDTVGAIYTSLPDPSVLKDNSPIMLRACFGPGINEDVNAEKIIEAIGVSSVTMVGQIVRDWYVTMQYEYSEKYDPNTLVIGIGSEDSDGVPTTDLFRTTASARKMLLEAYNEMNQSNSNSVVRSCHLYFDFADKLKEVLKGDPDLQDSLTFGEPARISSIIKAYSQYKDQKFLDSIKSQGFSSREQYRLFTDTRLSKDAVFALGTVGVTSTEGYADTLKRMISLSNAYLSASDISHVSVIEFLKADSSGSGGAAYIKALVDTQRQRAEQARRAAIASEKLRMAREKQRAIDFPLYAEVECGWGGTIVDIRGCFAGISRSPNTTITVRFNNQKREVQHWQFGEIGEFRNSRLYVDLPPSFAISAQNASKTLGVTIKIYDRLTKELLGSDMVSSQFGVAAIRN